MVRERVRIRKHRVDAGGGERRRRNARLDRGARKARQLAIGIGQRSALRDELPPRPYPDREQRLEHPAGERGQRTGQGLVLAERQAAAD